MSYKDEVHAVRKPTLDELNQYKKYVLDHRSDYGLQNDDDATILESLSQDLESTRYIAVFPHFVHMGYGGRVMVVLSDAHPDLVDIYEWDPETGDLLRNERD